MVRHWHLVAGVYLQDGVCGLSAPPTKPDNLLIRLVIFKLA